MKIECDFVDDEIFIFLMVDIVFLFIIYFMVIMIFVVMCGFDFVFFEEDDNLFVVEKEDLVLIEIQLSGEFIVDQKLM